VLGEQHSLEHVSNPFITEFSKKVPDFRDISRRRCTLTGSWARPATAASAHEPSGEFPLSGESLSVVRKALHSHKAACLLGFGDAPWCSQQAMLSPYCVSALHGTA
jgi:hypothetical protein